MSCSRCGGMRGGAIPEQLAHYQRLVDTRIAQLRKAEAARRTIDQQILALIQKFERLGIVPTQDHPRFVNLVNRYKSADDKVNAASAAISQATAKVTELMDQLPAYYAANPVNDENEYAGPPLGLDPTRAPLAPYDDNANRGGPPGPMPGQREGLGRRRKLQFYA
jgi:hypothetical protein